MKTVDEGIELLTGLPAGEPDERGSYPEGTLNGMVERRLAELGRKLRRALGPRYLEGDHSLEGVEDE